MQMEIALAMCHKKHWYIIFNNDTHTHTHARSLDVLCIEGLYLVDFFYNQAMQTHTYNSHKKLKGPAGSFSSSGNCSSLVSVAESLQVLWRTVHWLRGWCIAAPAVTFAIFNSSHSPLTSNYRPTHFTDLERMAAWVKLKSAASEGHIYGHVSIHIRSLPYTNENRARHLHTVHIAGE